jgi:hypothetical protein
MSGSSSSSSQAAIDDPNKGPVPDAFTPVFESQAVLTKRPQSLETGPEDGTVLTKRPQSLETSKPIPLSKTFLDLLMILFMIGKSQTKVQNVHETFRQTFGLVSVLQNERVRS